MKKTLLFFRCPKKKCKNIWSTFFSNLSLFFKTFIWQDIMLFSDQFAIPKEEDLHQITKPLKKNLVLFLLAQKHESLRETGS